ncbi:hypothetical protein [Solidesulfovibrio sp.]
MDISEETTGLTDVKIYFTDFYNVKPEILEEYGAFNVSLINDLPLFVDPFLLFDSKNKEYRRLHDGIIRYVKFLKEACSDGDISIARFENLFMFPEVRQNWFGFSKTGNRGSGLGKKFAASLFRNLQNLYSDFGHESVTKGTHLEKLCLIEGGVGRDHLSDFITNLIKEYLLGYTEAFALKNIDISYLKQFAVEKVYFDYEKKRWIGNRFMLPAWNGDYVLLSPKDILTKDEAWINRADLVDGFESIYLSIPNEQLRSQVNDYFIKHFDNDMKEQEKRNLRIQTIEKFPAVLDYYVKIKEDTGAEAHRRSSLKVKDTENIFIENVRELVGNYLSGTPFYELGDSYEESMQRVEFLKQVIENNDGYRMFYSGVAPI